MAGVFRKAMVWLGLAPDDEYDDYGYDPMTRQVPGPSAAPGYAPEPDAYGQARPAGPSRTVRPAPRGPAEPDEGVALTPRAATRPPGSGSVRPLPSRPTDPRVNPQREERPTVRPMRPTSAKPATVTPTDFDDAKAVADRFKAEQPVVMDLTEVEREVARRLIDFASGICYALSGGMERVRPGVYLLSPSGVEVSEEERRRLSGGR